MLWGNFPAGFIKKERLYLLMLLFIIAANLFLMSSHVERKMKLSSAKTVNLMSEEEMAAREGQIRELLERDNFLSAIVTAASFLFAIALISGLAVSIKCFSAKFCGRDFMAVYGYLPDSRWGFLDVIKALVVFLFLGYVLQFTGIFVSSALRIKSFDERFLTVVYATLMDILGIAVIFYFVVKKFGAKLSSLGLSFKNFLRNVGIGIIGYLALLPLLAITVMIVLWILHIVDYEQPRSIVLQIFYEDSRPKILLILTILVTVLGPIAEELFFRGMVYPAIRKKLGIKNSMILVSAAFAMLHLNILAFLPILILGILLAYLYEKTGSLVPSITVHIIHNSALVFSVYMYKMLTAAAGY